MPDQHMKKTTKMLITASLSILLVVVAGYLFNTFGVTYGPEQAGLTGIAGLIGGFKLLAGA